MGILNRLRSVGRVGRNILDGLAGPERTNENGETTKGFFRSKTNVAALATAITTYMNVTGNNFGLPEEELTDTLVNIGNAIGFLLIAIFRHISKTKTRIVS